VTTDNSGATTISDAVNISVNLANNLPQVTLTAPAGGLTFAAGGNINLAAEASDTDGVSIPCLGPPISRDIRVLG
jgi:hypothetical protein